MVNVPETVWFWGMVDALKEVRYWPTAVGAVESGYGGRAKFSAVAVSVNFTSLQIGLGSRMYAPCATAASRMVETHSRVIVMKRLETMVLCGDWTGNRVEIELAVNYGKMFGERRLLCASRHRGISVQCCVHCTQVFNLLTAYMLYEVGKPNQEYHCLPLEISDTS